MSRTRVKVCGICSTYDADTAVQAGTDAIGLVFYAKSPRYLSISRAREITTSLPPFVTAVGLFVNSSTTEVREVLSEVQLQLLQFHGDEDEAFCKSFDLPYIKALRVKPEIDLYQQCRKFSSARGVLLDSYRKGVPGGTGETFDWGLIPDDLPLPVILAGGMVSNNI
jgi:phosphoribosylanthranilate isomerase